ncbi:hypothetical protein D3C85_1674850 [compost metagenome]
MKAAAGSFTKLRRNIGYASNKINPMISDVCDSTLGTGHQSLKGRMTPTVVNASNGTASKNAIFSKRNLLPAGLRKISTHTARPAMTSIMAMTTFTQ